jgi:hypothetical protein
LIADTLYEYIFASLTVSLAVASTNVTEEVTLSQLPPELSLLHTLNPVSSLLLSVQVRVTVLPEDVTLSSVGAIGG